MSTLQKGVITYNEHPINFLGEMLCLTDMWKAAGEPVSSSPSEWQRSVDGEKFIEFISETQNMGISHVIKSKPGKGGGTWAYWQVAFAYAKKLSPEFHAWVNQAAREKMEAIAGGTSHLPPKSLDHVTRLRKAIALHGSALAFNKRQGMDLTQARLKAVATVKEQMGIDLPEELGWQAQPLAIQQRTVNATEIGRDLGLKNTEVNQLLEKQGYHVGLRDTKLRRVWKPTNKGMKFGRYEDKAKKHSEGTVQPWVWFESIVEELRPFAKTPAQTA
ncbi:KilA-N domain-containing protein [Acetobacter tropicalis]|uniref:KilA-N domain-containing protein n=1 Tax=Acetobacter tropicalis TaxID=104102 RepID=UPI0039755332